MLKISTDNQQYLNDLLDEAKLFFPDFDVEDLTILHHNEIKDNNKNTVIINDKIYNYDFPLLETNDLLAQKKLYKRAVKLALYLSLSAYTGKTMPWGSLTGVRPSKVAYDLLDSDICLDDLPANLKKIFYVSEPKANLLTEIIKNQKQYSVKDESKINLYIHIPFCTSRCNYCSFASLTLDKNMDLVEPYIKALKKEILFTLDFINSFNYKIDSIYIGGGTPTALKGQQLEELLKVIPDVGREFTCEAGRPDTITEEKLEVLKAYGVNRVSINAQSLHDKTLENIGRKHTAEDFFRAYDMAYKKNFIVNTDLIAGLTDESYGDFCYSLDKTLALNPHNITVHSLASKNGSKLKTEKRNNNAYIQEMIDFSVNNLQDNGYKPYYVYRQKDAGNLENVGYFRDNYICINNITSMEESLSVIGCGSGAISKRIFKANNRIERQANIKDVKLYIDNLDDRILRKKEFFNNMV